MPDFVIQFRTSMDIAPGSLQFAGGDLHIKILLYRFRFFQTLDFRKNSCVNI